MANKTLKALPGWIAQLLTYWGRDVDGALAEFNELAARFDLPVEWRDAVNSWSHNIASEISDPATAQALGLSIYLAVTSGPLGYNPDHAGLA